MSQLREHRERNTSAEVVGPLEERIREAGVEFLYYQFVSINGRVLSKVVPAKHLRRSLERGVQFHGSAVADLTTNLQGNLMAGGAEAEEITALPDPETFVPLPWDGSVGRFLCRLYRRDDRPEEGGSPLPTDVRGVLQRAHRDFEARTGFELRSGCEPEMSWLGESIDVVARPGVSPAYNARALERVRGIFQRVIRYATEMGFDMIEGDYEDNGQLELNWMFDRAELTADRLVTYRQICVQVATELGVKASFMPKPFAGIMGNGCHHNLSLWRAGANVFAEEDRRDLHVTEVARHAIGGILKHAAGGMAVMGPTVNSYKRFWDAGLFAPSQVNWGLDNKTCTVRVSANGRLEFKLPDASVNPYLSHTVLLTVIEDGLKNAVEPGEPQSSSSYEGEHGSAFEPLPMTLGDALTAFERDDVVGGALPPELARLYLEYKRDEWTRYCGTITEWENMMYLDWIP